MEYVALGRTNLLVSRAALAVNTFKLLSETEQAKLVRDAYDAGINYFDLNANSSADNNFSALTGAFFSIRPNIILGLCVTGTTPARIKTELEHALTALNTDYIDILHIAELSFVPAPGGDDGIAAALKALKDEGKIRFAGITEPFSFAEQQLASSSLFETLRFPVNATNKEDGAEKAAFCAKREIGCFASEPLCAPFEEIADAYSFLSQYEHIVPLWEVRTEEQMSLLLSLIKKSTTSP
jgi:aryl-alcohol dehydrogenase-like predicted oxidoreductase